MSPFCLHGRGAELDFNMQFDFTMPSFKEAAKQKRIESARLVFGMNGAEETWESINYHRNKIEMWQRIEADIRKRLRR